MKRADPAAARHVKWDAAEYAAHSVVQLGWARELITRLSLRGDERILDVGCGDGKVTAEIARTVPRGFVTGTDVSAEMIAFARKVFPAARHPNLRFEVCDARHLSRKLFLPPATVDLVFSNAVLHWVDDHEQFLRAAATVLHPGGRLIVSCGGRGNAHDVFLVLRPEMRLPRWREFFRRMPAPYFFHAPADYEKWLPQHGFQCREIKLAPKDVTYPGAGRLCHLVALHLDSLRPTGAGSPARGIYRRRHSPLRGQTSPGQRESRVHVRMVRLEIDAIKT